MYVETNKVEKMVSFLDVGLVSPFGRRRTVTEAGFVSIIEDILPLTTPGIVDREQEQRKREREREREEEEEKERKKVESRNVSTRTNTLHLPIPQFSSRFTTKELISFYFEYFLSRCSLNIFLFQPRWGKRSSVISILIGSFGSNFPKIEFAKNLIISYEIVGYPSGIF